jgi:V/A-type H+-transporting ATPase subunit E
MSAAGQSQGSFEDKMQNISEYLKTKVIDPAQSEKAKILEEAEAEKKQILENAKNEADKIITEAKSQAEQEKASLNSALRIASRQAVDSLKIALESEVLTKSVQEPSGAVLSSEEIIKNTLNEIIDIYLNKGSESVELVLSDQLKAQMSDYLKNEIKQKSASNISLSSESVPTGFSVKLNQKQLVYDFTQESLVELLSTYLRPELRGYLFSK